jgi:argonaute-like protein implicated in RNA metabolism and viral defense
MEILEDERMLMLKQDTIYQNMLRYGGPEVDRILMARKDIVDRDLNLVRNEIREYVEELFNHGE